MLDGQIRTSVYMAASFQIESYSTGVKGDVDEALGPGRDDDRGKGRKTELGEDAGEETTRQEDEEEGVEEERGAATVSREEEEEERSPSGRETSDRVVQTESTRRNWSLTLHETQSKETMCVHVMAICTGTATVAS